MNKLGNLTLVKFPVKMTKGREMWSHATFLTSNDRKISSMAKYILYSGVRVCNEFTPETFGRLTSVGRKFRIGKRTVQVFECSCGNAKELDPVAVKGGHTRSCGCLRSEQLAERNSRHGSSSSLEYGTWQEMIKRCYSKNTEDYLWYGAAGISVCDRWREPNGQGFINFLADMGVRPSPKHTMDRHPNRDGNYEPDNCRWATSKEQARNRNSNRMLAYNGKTQCLTEWAEELGIKPSTLQDRIQHGWTVVRAFTQPVKIPNQ